MTLDKRIEKLERKAGTPKPAIFLLGWHGMPEMTPEEEQALIEQEMRKNPGQAIYFIVVPRPWEI